MINLNYHHSSCSSSSSTSNSTSNNSLHCLPSFPSLPTSSPDLPPSTTSTSQPSQILQINPSSAPPSLLSHKPIPPPLSIVNQPSSDHNLSISEDIMTARCSQFPPIDPLQPTPPSLPSSRFQPYLSALSTDKSSWNQFNTSNPSRILPHPSSPSFALEDSPISSTDLNSSCSSLPSSTKHHSNFPPQSGTTTIRYTDSPPPPSAQEQLYPPLAPAPYAQLANYPVYTGPTQRPSLGLAYPAAAFTPSGGSPPITSPTTLNSSSFFHLEPAAGRRHTVSAYVSPSPIELGLVGCSDLDENYMKEEKRRRNKESSQRFRDRTRERQREKQERLEYLERRTKELESELRMRRSDTRSDGLGAPSPGASREHELVERLQAENKGLHSALKRAEEEINRLRQLAGVQSPESPFSVGQVYASLAQLSPPASGIGSGSQASSPAAEASYFGTRGTSPASDTPSTHHRLGGTGPSGMGYPVAEHRSQAAYHTHHMTAGQREFWEHATATANANVNLNVNTGVNGANVNVNSNEGAVAGWQAPEPKSLVHDQQQQ